MIPDEAFRERVRAALATPEDGPLATRFPAPFVTALVADASEHALLGPALAELVAALERVGVSRGRQFVLLGGDPVIAEARARASELRTVLGVMTLAHSSLPPGFMAGRFADGTAIELDDELREAEAIVTVGSWSARDGGLRGGAALLCPGVATDSTRAAWALARERGPAAAWMFLRGVVDAAPIDLSLEWREDGRVIAASGRHAFAEHARLAGVA